MEAIYAIKGRQAHVPLAVCLAEATKAQRYGHCEHLPQDLLPALLPGPVTVLLRRKPDAPLAAELTSRSPLIGVAPGGHRAQKQARGVTGAVFGCQGSRRAVWRNDVKVPGGSWLRAHGLRSLLRRLTL